MASLTTLAFWLFDPITPDGWASAIYWYQIPLLIILVVVIVLWMQYRKRQM